MDDSDDSDFYGNEPLRAALSRQVELLDLRSWWHSRAKLETPAQLQRKPQVQADTSHLHNPYAGVPYAWQLTETVDQFLDRLPPATTEGFPWIYVCNPYIQRRAKSRYSSQNVAWCEDEGPEDENADVTTLMEGGMERLHMVAEFIEHLRNVGKPPELMPRDIRKAGLDAAQDILGLAQHLHVTCGKWMLFCSTLEVNEVWEIVAKATANNELGIAAKVAAKSALEPDRAGRLICVYTADFNDKQDVRRVAVGLKKLGLIKPLGKPLYYKPDAYTYLGISSQNSWGVRASIYDSTTVLSKW